MKYWNLTFIISAEPPNLEDFPFLPAFWLEMGAQPIPDEENDLIQPETSNIPFILRRCFIFHDGGYSP